MCVRAFLKKDIKDSSLSSEIIKPYIGIVNAEAL